MAKFQFQCEELLKILPDLQCQECKDVPGPIGDKKYRYSCLDESHALCEEHKVHVIRFLKANFFQKGCFYIEGSHFYK